MTLNGVMALILRDFTEFSSFRGALHNSGWRCRKKFTFAVLSPDAFLVTSVLWTVKWQDSIRINFVTNRTWLTWIC